MAAEEPSPISGRPDTYAQAGFHVSDTSTPGHVYELSIEHHVRSEIKFDHVENWDIYAPQTEEEAGESHDAVSLEIDSSKNITIANYHGYRVTRTLRPFPAAVRIYSPQTFISATSSRMRRAAFASATKTAATHVCAPANIPSRTPSRT